MKPAWLVLMLAGCSTGSSSPDAATAIPDAAIIGDAGTELPDAALPLTTSLAVGFAGMDRELTRAQLGLEHADGGFARLYVEAHLGGDPACPDENSPTPAYTMILSNVPVVPDGTTVTSSDGVRVVLFDFTGDLFPGPAPARPSAVELVVHRTVTSGEPLLEGRLQAFFDGGTIQGTIHATHCASLDD